MLTILGGGGWFPAHGRQTACALLRDGERAIMIDAGTGVARAIERPELLDGIDELDIVLTHFHLDHIAGLAYLPATRHCPQTTVWGPGALLYERPTADLLARLSHEPFHPIPLEQQDITVRDVPAGEFELAGITVATRRQDRHSAPTLGLRFGDALTWITDTAFDPDSAAFAAGSALLAHEAWFTTAAPRNTAIHSSGAQAAEVAQEAGVEQLLLTHLPPFEQSIDAVLAEARELMPNARPAADGESLPVALG
jgi:ribonuclease BN (tRNA processing enzyme)